MDSKQFSERVKNYRRPTEHSQQELAERLGLHPTVLARKFSGTNKARFTHSEIKQIIKTLAEWEAITLNSQALELLALMELPATTFSSSEWAASPLSKLEKEAEADLPTAIIRRDTGSKESTARTPTNKLPLPLTQLIGREGLLRLASQRLLQAETRLLTLLGPGGIGKTRLSLEIGRRLFVQGKFKEGVYFVDLSNLTEAVQVPNHLAQKLGLTINPGESVMVQLQEYLANRHQLLILDNFEHLLRTCKEISSTV